MSSAANGSGKEILFREKQAFHLGWLRAALIALSAFLIALSLYIIYQQFFPLSPQAELPLSNGGMIVILIAMLVVGIGLPLFLFRAELLVTVDRQSVHISFAPFIHRTIAIASIVYCAPRTIQPLHEYIGMGILISLKGEGRGYSVGGNEGVQFGTAGGTRLFVGSQFPEELARAVADARAA